MVPAPTIAESCPPCSSSSATRSSSATTSASTSGSSTPPWPTTGYPRLANRWVDTCALARRLVRDEVPNCRLGTLAERFRLPHQPTHRALDDALATGDLLHVLLERAGTLGVLGLDDLLALPTIRAHPQVAKLRLTAQLPRAPGRLPVPRPGRPGALRRQGHQPAGPGALVLLRRRAPEGRPAAPGDRGHRPHRLLRPAGGGGARGPPHPPPPAAVQPPVQAVVPLRLPEAHPQRGLPPAVGGAHGEGGRRLPLPRPALVDGAARRVAEAIESAVPLRRCTARRPARPRAPPPPGRPCTAAQLGVAACPCAGTITQAEYAALVDRVVRGLTVDPALLLEPLEARMRALAAAERFEEAADVRDRAAALARALSRQRRLDALRRAGRVELDVDGARVVLAGGRLSPSRPPRPLRRRPGPRSGAGRRSRRSPLPRHLVDEVACVAAWLDAEGRSARLVSCEGPWTSALPALPRYEPGRRP